MHEECGAGAFEDGRCIRAMQKLIRFAVDAAR